MPHGFRSGFRDWAAECSDAAREVCELVLAHVNTNAIEAAYRRTDLFERRRALMEQWAAFLAGTADAVTVRGLTRRQDFGRVPRCGDRDPNRTPVQREGFTGNDSVRRR